MVSFDFSTTIAVSITKQIFQIELAANWVYFSSAEYYDFPIEHRAQEKKEVNKLNISFLFSINLLKRLLRCAEF